jgi:hypothetical protein
MRKVILLAPLMLASLSACTPQSYQVNPQPDASSESKQVPESQSKDYMRIIGDLRWDKLTSPKDWESQFPGCLESKQGYSSSLFANGSGSTGTDPYNPKCGFLVGGLQFSLVQVNTEKDPTGKRPFRTEVVALEMPREDQRRAFQAVFAEKYSATDQGTCSKYTCLRGLNFYPTPYTTSILDSVKVDPSAF